MGHSNLIFVIGIGLAIAGLTIGAAINMRRNAEGPEIASEYRVAREIAVSGLQLAKAQLADDYYLWDSGFTLAKPYGGGNFSAVVTPVDTGWVEVRSTGTYDRGTYLVIAEYVQELDEYDFGEKDKVTICHVTGSCTGNPDETISISWSAWTDSLAGQNKHGPINHCLTCTDSTGTPKTQCDHVGPCGKEPWQNVTGVTLLQYSEWRILN